MSSSSSKKNLLVRDTKVEHIQLNKISFFNNPFNLKLSLWESTTPVTDQVD